MGAMMSSTSQVFERCLRYMLRPIATFCIRNSIRLQGIIAVLKEVLVEASISELERRGEDISVSRISVMSGLHRIDVTNIHRFGKKPEPIENVTSRVIDRWHQDRRFSDKHNKPKILEFEGVRSEFFELVQSVSRALNPYTVLFELERIGIVERAPQGLKLRTRVYVAKDMVEGYSLLGEDTRDLISAVSDNLSNSEELPNLHIKTEYDNIPVKHRETIKRWLLKEGSAFHRRARVFLAKLDRDFSPEERKSKGRLRVVVGSFSRSETVDKSE
ncbi:MAG: hypothetical protein K1X83_10855 [Oligoflexia bacterium]|nr:hypothetical protein [Oligoflexia bacterium]